MRKIVFISTTNVTINSFLLDIIHKLKKNNKIFILTNFNDNKKKIEGIEYVHINFQRKIHIVKDLISLVFLIKNIFFIKPDLIYTITPKAGFLGIISSFLLRVKTRIHIFTGQVWITKFGIIREILKIVDKIILKLSTNCLIDSHAQKKFLIESKIFNKFNFNKIRVLGDGSICGVDTSKFKPNMLSRVEIRAKYNIPQNDKIIIFVGRLNVDKGVLDLVEAYNKICLNNKINDTHLLIVGDVEQRR